MIAPCTHSTTRQIMSITTTLYPPSFLYCNHSIGNVLKKKGALEEAQTYYERALRGRAKSLGNDHLTTANTAAQLAGLLAEQVEERTEEGIGDDITSISIASHHITSPTMILIT